MFKGIVFRDEVEDLVQFVEETDPSEIIERTLDKLRAGTPVVDLLRAGALAVCRSTELPPEHHGGPVHPDLRDSRRVQHLPQTERRDGFHAHSAARGAV